MLALDTTGASLLHRLARGRGVVRIYVTAVILTYIPLAIAAVFFGPLAPFFAGDGLRLPFLRDWNVAFLLLVSFPVIVIFTVTDDALLNRALAKIEEHGIISPDAATENVLEDRWPRIFRKVNLAAYVVGIVGGALVTTWNYLTYSPPNVGFWIARHGDLVPAGYLFLYCIFLVYAVIPLYIARSVATSFFLRDIVRRTELRMLPAHPDHCGGLRPIGHLGLRNQYVLSILGLNVVALVLVTHFYLTMTWSLRLLIVAAVTVYLLFGPVIFMGPLLSFRSGMIQAKERLMADVAQRLRIELTKLHEKVVTGAETITKEEEGFIERLRKRGSVIDELPVWPFDARTLRRCVTAYIAPLILGAVGKRIGELLGQILR